MASFIANFFPDVTPLTRRRWYSFKSNKRGYRSLWIFLALLLVSLPAEFIANDKPILVEYENKFYYPILIKIEFLLKPMVQLNFQNVLNKRLHKLV